MEGNRIPVSVIVPVYKVERYMERCARSLFEQTLEGMEYVFVNDCTPDGSMEILLRVMEEYPERKPFVKIVEHSVNRGLAQVRNSGLEVATGQYVIHCDSDDWVEREMYEVLYRTAMEKDADIVGCDYYAAYEGRQVCFSQCFAEDAQLYLRKLLQGSLHNAMWNKLIKRDLYDKLPFYWKAGVNMWEDVSVVLRLAYHARRVVYVPRAFYHYSQVNANAYTQSWSAASLKNVVEVVAIIDSFFRHSYEVEMLDFKLRAKYCLLQYGEVAEYRNIYPETNRRLLFQPALPVYKKCIMWCQVHSLDGLAGMIAKFVHAIKKRLR